MIYFSKFKIYSILLSCLVISLFAIPNFVDDHIYEDIGSIASVLPEKRINLGLDLQGGSQLLLEVDFKSYLKDQLTNLQDIVRQELSKSRIGYRNLKSDSNNVYFKLRDVADEKKVRKILKSLKSEFVYKNQDFKLFFDEDNLEKLLESLVNQSIEIIRRRVDETGTTEPIIQRQGSNRILLQAPGLANPESLKIMLGKTAKLSFHLVDQNLSYQKISSAPVGKFIAQEDSSRRDGSIKKKLYVLDKKILLSGDLLVNAVATIDQNNRPSVNLSFNRIGAKKFGDITRKNTKRLMAIVLDGKVISAANINEPIYGGSAVIHGNFSVESANDLALLLRAGALPAPLHVIEERTVGPSLGVDSIASGKKAGIYAAFMVVIFTLLTYGVFGLFANFALAFNVIMIIALLSFLQATLTLPGIAGIVLTIGMAIDANVLIFERIKEEFRAGFSVINAVDRGFKQAFGTIIDSNLTTIIAALLLYSFGSGSVRGFAITLTIGILSSMFSAITLTRLMVYFWLKNKKREKISF